jgi:VIT1/CCC1 family predicted Fe2+/Mn2+ transporter
MFDFLASILTVLGLTGSKLTLKNVISAMRHILQMDITERSNAIMALVMKFVPSTVLHPDGTETERTADETQSYMRNLVLKISVYLYSHDLRHASLAVAAEDSKTRMETFRAGLKAAGLEPQGEISVGKLLNISLPSGRLENYRKTVLNSFRKLWSLKSMGLGIANNESLLYTGIDGLTSEERAAFLTMLQSQYQDNAISKMRSALIAAYPDKAAKLTAEYFAAKTAKAIAANDYRRMMLQTAETETAREKVEKDYPYTPMPNEIVTLSNMAAAYNSTTARMCRDAKATADKTRREVQNDIRAARPQIVSLENRDIRLMPVGMQDVAIKAINNAVTLMSFGWGIVGGAVTVAEALQEAWKDFFSVSWQWHAGTQTLFLIAKMAKFRMLSGRKAIAVDSMANGKTGRIYIPLQSEGEEGETLDVSDSIMPRISPEHSQVETNQVLEFLMKNGTLTDDMAGTFELQTEGETEKLIMPKLSTAARKAIEAEYRTQKDGTTKRLPNAGNAFDGTPRQWVAVLIEAYKERESAFAAELDSLGVVGAERAEYAAMFAAEKIGPAPFGPRIMGEKDSKIQVKKAADAVYYAQRVVTDAACILTGIATPAQKKAANKARAEQSAAFVSEANATAQRAAERVTNIMAALQGEPDNVKLQDALRGARLESEHAQRAAERVAARFDSSKAILPYSFAKATTDGEVWRGPLATALQYSGLLLFADSVVGLDSVK